LTAGIVFDGINIEPIMMKKKTCLPLSPSLSSLFPLSPDAEPAWPNNNNDDNDNN
jgi:hypothetical protein